MPTQYEDILMPKNTAVPLVIGAFCLALGFGLVWRIWWMTDVSLLGVILTVIARSFVRVTDYVVGASEVEQIERRSRTRGQSPRPDSRRGGMGVFRPSRSNT